jgi:DNA repair exonuclease SbcCD ATPase subunit
MHVAAINLFNFGPFLGEQRLDLQALAYSVVAERAGDKDASNWAGKSSLLESIVFAFYGEHRHRLEAGWISEGEAEGRVVVALSDGTIVQRYRQPGAGTQLTVSFLGRDQTFRGPAAQVELERHLGLSLEDFRTTSWLAQGQASAIVRGDPATRTAMVARWLGIERLEGALRIARTRSGAEEKKAQGLRARIAAQEERLARAKDGLGPCNGELDHAVKLRELEEKLAEWDELLALANEEEAGKRLAVEREKVEAELVGVEVILDGLPAVAQNVLSAAKKNRDLLFATFQAAKTKRDARQTVARGTFDGKCPVAGIACPATQMINDLGGTAKRGAEEASREALACHTAFQESERTLRDLEGAGQERSRVEARLQGLQDRLASMGGTLGALGGSGLVLGAVRAQRDAVLAEVQGVRFHIREVEAAWAELEQLRREAREVAGTLGTAREGSALLVKAPRKLAEGALAVIAREANDILAQAGVDLTLGVSWERATKDPAEQCDACGAAFPRSARVKACESCQEPRGVKRTRRLDVELSARSGAAEDLAGLALSLAAGTWLRGERGSAFGVALLDEVGSQLDKSHRRMMAQHLPRMLSAARVDQAFVVSHSPESVASLPGRIVVRSDGKWARVEVV